MATTIKVRVEFVDGNSSWSERGFIRRAKLGPAKSDGFVLDSDEGGTRVFPLWNRQATVYLSSLPIEDICEAEGRRDLADDRLIYTCDDVIHVDKLDELLSLVGGLE